MGTWGVASFENDEALDWLGDLIDEGDPYFVSNTLMILADFPESEMPESWDCSCALAAAEMVAAARGQPVEPFPPEAGQWLAGNQFELDEELIETAIKAVDRVLTHSELKELWEQSEEKERWHANIQNLKQRLL